MSRRALRVTVNTGFELDRRRGLAAEGRAAALQPDGDVARRHGDEGSGAEKEGSRPFLGPSRPPKAGA